MTALAPRPVSHADDLSNIQSIKARLLTELTIIRRAAQRMPADIASELTDFANGIQDEIDGGLFVAERLAQEAVDAIDGPKEREYERSERWSVRP